ncbi:MAG: CaiB/BaiF CoA-transferase family protein, partial [Candidatus Binatia bacterium]
QNLAPGAARRLDLDADRLTARHPTLIACDVSGYGSTGPYAEKKAYDLLIQCETGLVSITGTPEAPAKAGISVADIAGGMYAFSGILAALYDRERTGLGTALEVSLFDSLAEWMTQPWYLARYDGDPPPRSGADHATIAPYGPFGTADGQRVNLGIQNEPEWQAFCRTVLRREDLAGDPRFAGNASRVAHRAELHEEIDAVLSGLDAEELLRRLDEASIAYGLMREPGDIVGHPQMLARDRWRTVDSPGGPVLTMLPPITLRGRDPRMGPIPAIGQHTGAIRRWLRQSEVPA